MTAAASAVYDVVVVDDDELSLEAARRALRRTDLTFNCFDDELAALAWLENASARLLFVDQRMPRLDGIDLIERLVAAGRVTHSRVFLLSSVPMPEALQARARRLGATPALKDLLRAPARLADLLGAAQ